MEFAGEFETHITVSIKRSEQAQQLLNWAEAEGFKFLHIWLARGEHCSQPMVTQRSRGSLSQVLQEAYGICDRLTVEGFQVVRVKLEAAPWNQDIPQTAAEIGAGDRYFEHHFKLKARNSDRFTKLLKQLKFYNAHLSRNAVSHSLSTVEQPSVWQERFVTQRCRNVGQNEAHQQLQVLQKVIENLGYPILETTEEYVVYDSNLSLDAGWLNLSSTAGLG